MAPPTLAHYGRHFETTVPTIQKLTEKIRTADEVDEVRREYRRLGVHKCALTGSTDPAGFDISKRMV